MKHPYATLFNYHFWSRTVSNTPYNEINFFPQPKFTLQGRRKIATAGSCFAQNIARYLRENEGHFYDAEPPHPLLPDEYAQRNGYGVFSARFGNVYTVRQLIEIIYQAFGLSKIIYDFSSENGLIYDLLRPSVQQDGFSSPQEAQADRNYHLSKVKELFLHCDVFIFTLGLTEVWHHAQEGYVYPACPGTSRGVYNPELHQFKNLTFEECYRDLEKAIHLLSEINPRCRWVLTVSPVGLAATYEDQNVLCATSYSKSVLRAVCGQIERQFSHVQYFPSYEIISSACSFGQYLSEGLREANRRGIAHVMQSFTKAFYPQGLEKKISSSQIKTNYSYELSRKLVNADCDEMFNNPDMARA